MVRSVEIAFLFMSFKRLRLEREQIREIFLDLEQLTSDTSLTLYKKLWSVHFGVVVAELINWKCGGKK